MKILHVITTIERGGAENHLADLMEQQVAGGHSVTVAYLKYDGYWRRRLEAAGVAVVDLRMRRYGDPRALFKLRHVLWRVRPDVVHAHMPPAELYTRLALLGDARTPLVISKHNDEPFYKGRGADALGRWVARRASRIIAISSAVNRYMTDRAFLPADRVTTIHYGMDPAPYTAVTPETVAALRAEWGVGKHEFLVGTVARLVPQKALHILLQGFAAFRRGNSQARLVLVGRGPLEAELKMQAESLALGDSVIWAGFRTDIPAVMKSFDVFALTSIYEGFGLVLLESMAAGRPVVASRVSAIPEVVDEGVTGLLIAPQDPEALTGALRKLEVPEIRRAMGEGGFRRLQDSFSLRSMCRNTEVVYWRALKRSPD